MSTVIKSAEPCPICLLQNKTQNPLNTRPGQFFTTCSGGHKFEDTEELRMLQQQARAKYPNVYAMSAPAAAAPMDPEVLAGQDIVITAEMKKMMEDISGVKFTGASDLKGLIFALSQDNHDKEAEIRSLQATMATMRRRVPIPGAAASALGPGQVVISIPEWAIEGVSAQAEHAHSTMDEWVTQEMEAWFESYFGRGPGQQ